MQRTHLDALLRLSGIKPLAVYEIANQYWGQDSEVGRANPWWLVLTAAGPIVIGWRKRVISINWKDTYVRAKATIDEGVTSELDYCHAWSYAKAVEYLTTLQSAFNVALMLRQSAAVDALAPAAAEVQRKLLELHDRAPDLYGYAKTAAELIGDLSQKLNEFVGEPETTQSGASNE